MTTMDYQQNKVVTNFHNAPRFGYSSSIATLVSASEEDSWNENDYTKGILAFCVFLSILFIVWGLVLIFLKLRFGVKGVGCAAGGDIVDVAALRANKLSRAQRKKRIVRAWRTQSVFLLATLAVPTLSLLLVNHGLRPFIASLDSLVDVTDKVDSAAFLGIHIVDSVTARYRELVEIPIIDIQSFCPNALAPDTVLASLGAYALPETLQLCLQMIDSFVQDYVTAIRPALTQVTDATRIVDEVIDSVYNHYWILKLLLLVLNVANGFFIFGVLLSKNGCVYAAFQAMMSYLILPVFALALIASVGLTCATVSLTLVNADFCAGGSFPGSPQGTIQDFVVASGYPIESMTFLSVASYIQSCQQEYPLDFVIDFESQMGRTSEIVSSLVSKFDAYNITELSQACGANLEPVNATLHLFEPAIESLYGTARAATRLSSCSESIEPIIRELVQGRTCTQSVHGLSWLFASMLCISIFGLIILSTRAALFNPVIMMKRRKRREKEWEEYRDYMGQVGYDTSMWKLDVAKKALDASLELPHAETFDTEDTSATSTPREEGDDVDPVVVAAAVSAGTAAVAAVIGSRGLVTAIVEEEDNSYYSDSSSEDEDDTLNDAGSKSTMTGLSTMLGRFFALRIDHNDGISVTDSTYHAGSFPPVLRTKRDLLPSPKAPKDASPSFLTPRRRHLSIFSDSDVSHRSQDRQHMLDEEIRPLSPSPVPNRQPKAPRKDQKQLRRTHGAAKMC